MKHLPLAVALSLVASCEKPSKTNSPEVETVQKAESSSDFDYDKTLSRIKQINTSGDYTLFQDNWIELREVLSTACKNGDINELSVEDRSALWNSIEFMRGCAHPRILHDHSEEILPILFAFDLPDLNKSLREVLSDLEQM